MLRVRRKANGDVVFILSGRIDKEHIVELEAIIASDVNKPPPIWLHGDQTEPRFPEWAISKKGKRLNMD